MSEAMTITCILRDHANRVVADLERDFARYRHDPLIHVDRTEVTADFSPRPGETFHDMVAYVERWEPHDDSGTQRCDQHPAAEETTVFLTRVLRSIHQDGAGVATQHPAVGGGYAWHAGPVALNGQA